MLIGTPVVGGAMSPDVDIRRIRVIVVHNIETYHEIVDNDGLLSLSSAF